MFEYNPELSELYVATKTDVRWVDLHTGKVKKVLASFIDSDSEITMFRLYLDKKNFIIGNSAGEIKIFSSNDGKFKAKLFSHQSDISAIEFDERNNLIISAGWDSKIMVQEEKSDKPIKVQK